MASILELVRVPPAVTGQGGVAATARRSPTCAAAGAGASSAAGVLSMAGVELVPVSVEAMSPASAAMLSVLTVLAGTPSPVTVSRAMAESMAANDALCVEGIRASEPRADSAGDGVDAAAVGVA